MKSFYLSLMICCLMGFLCSCGQSGRLYLPLHPNPGEQGVQK
ncbi:MAG TPA: hypothetical protein VLI69_08580 [Gammaproteobacteria bacterium]|nr:hypothetical protein [Gammaproteobacteria bacterium]